MFTMIMMFYLTSAMSVQTYILYIWICRCATCLKKGFCGHCFFVEHHNHDKHPCVQNVGLYTHCRGQVEHHNHDEHHDPTPIPESVDVRSLSSISDNRRPFIRRGRPSHSFMTRSLELYICNLCWEVV